MITSLLGKGKLYKVFQFLNLSLLSILIFDSHPSFVRKLLQSAPTEKCWVEKHFFFRNNVIIIP